MRLRLDGIVFGGEWVLVRPYMAWRGMEWVWVGMVVMVVCCQWRRQQLLGVACDDKSEEGLRPIGRR